MSTAELIIIALGLSMDACAVSVCKGLSVCRLKLEHALKTGLYFGAFQGLMPLIGYLLGFRFEYLIKEIDHWVAFVLLAVIGINMIRESFGEAEDHNDDFGVKTMLVMAVATSIDALAVGIGFAFLDVNIIAACLSIALITFFMSAAGTWVGHKFGERFKARAEFAGGVILICMGLKILLEHLGIINF